MRMRAKMGVLMAVSCLCCLLTGFFVGRFYEAHRQTLRPCSGEGAEVDGPIILRAPTSPPPPEIDHIIGCAARVAVLEQQQRRAELLLRATEAEWQARLYEAVVLERVRLTGMPNPPEMRREWQ